MTMTAYWYYIMQTGLALLCVGLGAGLARIVLADVLAAKDEEIERLTRHKRDLLRWVRVGVKHHGLEPDPWVQGQIARFEGARD